MRRTPGGNLAERSESTKSESGQEDRPLIVDNNVYRRSITETDPSDFGDAKQERIHQKIESYKERLMEIRRIETLRQSKPLIEQEKPLSEEEVELAREAAKITLSRVDKWSDLWAENEEEGDEKFRELTRKLWANDIVVHYTGVTEKDKHYPDLDGKIALGLLRVEAKMPIKQVHYVGPGRTLEGMINIDTSQSEGVTTDFDTMAKAANKTARIDHHGEESRPDTSAGEKVYSVLKVLGLVEKDPVLDKVVSFLNQVDNKIYPNRAEYFNISHRTMLGLARFVTYENLKKFFEDGRHPTEELSDQDLIKYGFKDPKDPSKDRSKDQLALVKKAKELLPKMEAEGQIIETEELGKVVVDVGRKLEAGDDAVVAEGYDSYLLWNPPTNSFFLSTTKNIPENFELSQGINIRGKMFIKGVSETVPLRVKFSEMIYAIAGPDYEPTGNIKKWLQKEKRGEPLIEVGQIITDEEIEDSFKKDAVWISTGASAPAYLNFAGEKTPGKKINFAGIVGLDYKIVEAFSSDYPDKIRVVYYDIREKKRFWVTFLPDDFLEVLKPQEALRGKKDKERYTVSIKFNRWVIKKLSGGFEDEDISLTPPEPMKKKEPKTIIVEDEESEENADLSSPSEAVPTTKVKAFKKTAVPGEPPEVKPDPDPLNNPAPEGSPALKSEAQSEKPFNGARITTKKFERKQTDTFPEKEEDLRYVLKLEHEGKKLTLREGMKIEWQNTQGEEMKMTVKKIVPHENNQYEIHFAETKPDIKSKEEWAEIFMAIAPDRFE